MEVGIIDAVSEFVLYVVYTILMAAASVIAGYGAAFMRKLYENKRLERIANELLQKEDFTRRAVLAAQQIWGKTLNGPERYEKAYHRLSAQLETYGLKFTPQELEDLIESVYKELKIEYGKYW